MSAPCVAYDDPLIHTSVDAWAVWRLTTGVAGVCGPSLRKRQGEMGGRLRMGDERVKRIEERIGRAHLLTPTHVAIAQHGAGVAVTLKSTG